MMKHIRMILTLLVCLFALCALSGALGEVIPVTLSDEGCACASDLVECTPEGVTITAPGEYILSGALSDGRVLVDCREEGKVTLHLNGVDIHSETGPAIQIGHAAPRVVLSLSAGSENRLSNGAQLMFTDGDEPNGVIFSRSDLTITGSGSLTVTAGAYDGIVSKDDLRIEGGTVTVTAPRHGIRGKDCVEISSGTITVRAGKDGLRTTNTMDPDRGYIAISGGTVRIACGDDPLDYVTALTVTGGTVDAKKTPAWQ